LWFFGGEGFIWGTYGVNSKFKLRESLYCMFEDPVHVMGLKRVNVGELSMVS
jgi:hypothetical protein